MRLKLELSHITEVELTRMLANLQNAGIDVRVEIDRPEPAKEFTKSKLITSSLPITEVFEMIISETSKITTVSIEAIRAPQKGTKDILSARYICANLMYKYTAATLGMIGDYLGGRDHSTISTQLQKHKDFVMIYSGYRAQSEKIETIITDLIKKENRNQL